MPDLKISQLATESPLTGTELVELVTGGINKKATTQDIANLSTGITREFNRTFVEDLLFDKNEIFHAPTTMTGDFNLTIAAGGLNDEASAMRFRFTADGVSAINFGVGFDFLYGITNGEVLPAGTYEMYLLYTNGSVSVNLPGTTSQESSAVTLAAPGSFNAVADGENEIDLTWADVANESSYLIEFSLTGTGGWATLSAPAAGATSASQTGLNPGDTRFYRIKAVGDGVNFLDSGFSTAAATTESAGDVTAPTFTFSPASGNTTWPVNRPIVLTADEGIQNTDGSEITNANVATRITLKETNSGGADIAFTATIDVTKTIVTIFPTTQYGETQLVYVAINNVEDVNGNEVTVAISSTFTTTDYSYLNGTSNRVAFGDILDSLFTANDTNFWLELTVNNMILSGYRPLVTKWDASGSQRAFHWYAVGTDVFFGWAGTVGGGNSRYIKWTNVLTAGAHILVLKYDGAIDTNDGLDRVTLLIDGGTAGSKSLLITDGSLTLIANSTAQLAVGTYVNAAGTVVGSNYYAEEAKDFIVRSTAGATVVINVPNLRNGQDTSGNAHHGTWA